MAYRIVLTARDRYTIDFCGDSDWVGHDLYKLLWVESTQEPDDVDWGDDPRDMTCIIPEHVAWEIQRLYQEADCYPSIPHIYGELEEKLMKLLDSIV